MNLMLIIGALVAAAGVLAALGFSGRAVHVGIDLGTTFSALAYRSASGRDASLPPQVLLHANNRSTLQSLLAVRDGAWVVGQDALPLVASHPWSAIVDAKRIIGRMSNDATLIAEAHRHEGRLVPHPRIVRDAFGKQPATAARRAACDTCEPEIAFALHFHASQVSALTQLAADACMDAGSVMTQPQLQAWLHTRHWNATRIEAASASDAYLLVTPTAAACVLVRHMLDRLRTVLGHSQFSIGAITVPAEFDARQRQCTLDAYARAGLTATRVLHEPAAAAIAYGLHTRSDVQYVLVFDMGGGTLDISILYLQYNTFTVISTAGDGHLGGEDVDDCVLRIMESQLNNSDSASYAQARDASHAQEVPLCGPVPLKQQAEAAKIALSHADEAAWCCSVPAELPAADDEDTTLFPAAATMPPGIVRHTISRALFESSCASLWDRVLDPVRRALDAANLEPREIDQVVLVGGSSRLLPVRAALTAFFEKPLQETVDPDLAVAIGAAMPQ